MKTALEIRHLSKDYGSFKLDDVSLTLPGGAIMGLIGENGAGKSTTIKCILGLVQRDGGEIELLGRDSRTDFDAIKEDIGVVLDESTFHDTLKTADVSKILAHVYRNWDGALFVQYLEKFSLPTGKTIKTFSRGMKMKLSIAAALSHRPKLLILDEATGGLDPVVRDDILEEFLSFIQDEDHSILVSSHITSDLEKVADYVTFLHQGKVQVQGAKDEILGNYGRLICTRADLNRIDHSLLAGMRISQFSCEALVTDRRAFSACYPGLTLDQVTLEDIMVFTVKGEKI